MPVWYIRPPSIIKRLKVRSQGWAMCLNGAQLSSPHYLSQSGRWIWALRHSLSYRLTKEGWVGGVNPGLGYPQLLYVCLISQFISQAWLSGEPSAPAIHQDLSASHHNWEMRLGIRIPLAPSAQAVPPSRPVSQPAPCSGLKEIIKLYQWIRNTSRFPPTACHSLCTWDILLC